MKYNAVTHLRELRNRLIWVASTWLIATIIAFILAEPLYQWLVKPLAEASNAPRRLIYTGLAEGLYTYLKLAFFAGFVAVFPFTSWQLYRFITPALYASEKRVFMPSILGAPVLFYGGIALAYYVIFPLAWGFFLSFELPSLPASDNAPTMPIILEARMSEYLGTSMHIMLAFGIAFQLPLVLLLMLNTGVVAKEQLQKARRYAIIGILLTAAIATPPDVISQLGLAIPLILLYEAVILIGKKSEG